MNDASDKEKYNKINDWVANGNGGVRRAKPKSCKLKNAAFLRDSECYAPNEMRCTFDLRTNPKNIKVDDKYYEGSGCFCHYGCRLFYSRDHSKIKFCKKRNFQKISNLENH